MTDTPWTPGPWDQIGKDLVPQRYVVWRSSYNDATDTRIIATEIATEADARLIAAAPELVELLELLSVGRSTSRAMALRKEARSLLAHIRGES